MTTKTGNAPLLFTGFVRDLSELREAETRGNAAARQLAAAEGLSAMGRWECDLSSNESQWSEELFRIHGLEPAGFLRAAMPSWSWFIPSTARR